MRTHALRLFGLLTCLALVVASTPSSAGKERLTFDPERPLLTGHSTPRQQAEADLDAVLSDLFSTDAGATPKPLVVYVHGRGHEPKKSFADSFFGTKNKVIEKIEEHGVLVLGVGWDSSPSLAHPFCSRPIDAAIAAGPLFARTVHALLAHRAANPRLWRERKVILLVHSMGGFVLRDAMARPGVPRDVADLFDTRIVSESDVPASEHLKWLPTDAPGHTYVVSNSTDSVLARSASCDKAGKPEIGPRLGELPAVDAPSPLPNVTYLQLAAGKRHRVFTKSGANGNPWVCQVMDALLHGVDPGLDPAWRVGAGAFRVPGKSDPKDRCFAGALADQDDDD